MNAAPCTLLWPAAMIVWGPGYTSSGHAHHCVQLVMALRGTLRIRGRVSDEWMKCGAALVRPDAEHEVAAHNKSVLIAFVDPESDLGAALLTRVKQDITRIGSRELARWRGLLGNSADLSATEVERWVREQLLESRKTSKLHPGVRRVLRFVREQMPVQHVFGMAELANIARLSPSRLRHVFTESVGVPFRPYLLWLRVQRACGELMRGASVTQAAHAAGFCDAAHMARTFRRMLGTTPSELAGRRQQSRAAFVESG